MAKKNDFNYFDYFCATADKICDAAKLLNDSIKNFNHDTFKQKVDEMHVLENEADMAKHEMTKRLMHEFLPPIEREDIIDLMKKHTVLTEQLYKRRAQTVVKWVEWIDSNFPDVE